MVAPNLMATKCVPERHFVPGRGGRIIDFQGPNGAGKGGLINIILATLALPTDGAAKVGGFVVVHQAASIRRVALRKIALDQLQKPIERLSMQARLFCADWENSRSRAGQLIELVGLTGAKDRRVGTLSGGMRRLLALSPALRDRLLPFC